MTDLVDAEQLGDAARALPVLVPNERGLDRALELGLQHIAIFGSATETFAQRNLNRSLDEQFAMFEPTVTRAREAGMDVRAYVSMCFGDPWEGAVPIEQVVTAGTRLLDLGAGQLSLGDTIGVATAGHVTALVAAFAEAREVDEGTEVIGEGEFSRALMAIEGGTAEVTRDGERIAELGPGDIFGEAGMLGYVKGVQRKEIREGIACVKHQNMSGSDIGDDHKEYFAGEAALKAGGTHNTMNQFAA